MRLPRNRRGKTAVDVVIVEQEPGYKRIRLTLGESYSSNKKNTDMNFDEAEDLITLLQYHLALAKGEVNAD